MDAFGASSPLGNGGDGKTLHLGGDLPDLPPTLWDTQQSDRDGDDGASGVDMGNAESRKETNAAVHALGDELTRRREAATAAGTRQSTGKLKRPSDSLSNPACKNPVLAPKTQRKLGEKNRIRKSTYDLEESPEKTSPVKLRKPEQAPQFSPVRANRKRKQQAVEASEQEDEPSPRRSARTRKFTPKAGSYSSPSSRRPELASEAAGEEDDAEHTSSQQAMFRDFVPATVAAKYQEAEAEAEAEAGAEDGIEAADDHDDGVEDEERATEEVVDATEANEGESATRKKAPGRPKKRSSAGKPGRPAKTSAGAAQESEGVRRSPRKPKEPVLRISEEVRAPSQQPKRMLKAASKPGKKTNSTRSSARQESALEELSRRRSSQHPFDEVNDDEWDLPAASDNEAEQDGDGAPRVKKLTAKDLFSSRNEEDSMLVADQSGSQEQPNQSKKRKKGSSAAK